MFKSWFDPAQIEPNARDPNSKHNWLINLSLQMYYKVKF